jgi:hypothetical protein
MRRRLFLGKLRPVGVHDGAGPTVAELGVARITPRLVAQEAYADELQVNSAAGGDGRELASRGALHR